MMPRSNLIDAFVAIYATNPSIIVRVACVWIHVPLNYAVGVSQWELKGIKPCDCAGAKPAVNLILTRLRAATTILTRAAVRRCPYRRPAFRTLGALSPAPARRCRLAAGALPTARFLRAPRCVFRLGNAVAGQFRLHFTTNVVFVGPYFAGCQVAKHRPEWSLAAPSGHAGVARPERGNPIRRYSVKFPRSK